LPGQPAAALPAPGGGAIFFSRPPRKKAPFSASRQPKAIKDIFNNYRKFMDHNPDAAKLFSSLAGRSSSLKLASRKALAVTGPIIPRCQRPVTKNFRQ
jgi:hypothetical protein